VRLVGYLKRNITIFTLKR